jgi:hypothetical protein
MGKRSDFERVKYAPTTQMLEAMGVEPESTEPISDGRDFYPTPIEAVWPLMPHLMPGTYFVEPCAGDGRLINHITAYGYTCTDAYDLYPMQLDIDKKNVLDIKECSGDCFITNPPWDRKILHPIIEHLSEIAPTWLLFDADWMHTKQAAPLMRRCAKIISVGRIKWIAGSKNTGKDNCCWYLFDIHHRGNPKFWPRI